MRAGWGWRGLEAPFCMEVTMPCWHSQHGTRPAALGAQHRPVPPADVQMFPGTPLAAACVWKVMNFCTS